MKENVKTVDAFLKRIVVRRKPNKSPSLGIILAGGCSFPCLLGKNGIGSQKKEGDWLTPAGQWPLLYGYYRKDRIKKPTTSLDMRPIQADEGWCDEPSHRNYNQLVKLPFDHSHEKMARQDGLYDICLIMDHNISKRSRNRGSAIFFHLTADKPYTAGCIGVSPATMKRLLPQMEKGTIIDIQL